jgi:putative transposase
MSYLKIWVHLVWSTKNRQPLLSKEIRSILFPHIKKNAQQKGIYIDFINGHIDHIHILISLNKEQSIGSIVQLIKGESSYWINQQKLTTEKFRWQDQYFAVSVSESGINKVREYIKTQEEHHKKKTFQQEYEEFMQKYGFKIISSIA